MFGLTKSTPPDSPTARPVTVSGGQPPPLTDNAIAALVTLLGREHKRDNLVIIRTQLEELGAAALPWLDASASEDASEGGAAAELAMHIRRQALEADWIRWAEASDPDLETGAALIDRFGDPLRDPAVVTRSVDRLAEELGRRLAGASDMAESIVRLKAFLFSELEFHGNTASYEDPENSYLSCVLARRRGIPVSLSVVLLLLAQRLDLPMVGIGMPGHFLVRYGTQPSGPYLDAFGGGRVLTREDCAGWLRASGFTFDARMLRPVGPRYIVARMLRNLVAVFTKRGASPEAQILTRYLKRVVAGKDSGAMDEGKTRPRVDRRLG